MGNERRTEARELEALAEGQSLQLDIVYAKLPNTPPNEPHRFYLVAENGALLYEPRDIGGTFDAASMFIRGKAAERAAFAYEMSRPYYGG
jgi:hypothetical protein